MVSHKKIRSVLVYTLTFLSALCSFEISAANSPSDIRLQGRSEAVVTESVVRLGDIALIESAAVADDELIADLRRIQIANSPSAGESLTIEGVAILDKLRDAGIKLDSILYTFPRQLRVTRAYREVSINELESALQSFLSTQDRNIEVRHLLAEKPVKVPADAFNVEVVALRPMQPGQFGIDYRSRASSGDLRFQMKALADEWRVMPTATRALKRGEIVTASDVRLAKINGTATDSDSLDGIGDVVGHELTRDVGQGELFSSKTLKLPPVVKVGSQVTMLFSRGRLEASARGVALEDGGQGQEISVRNEGSKKVVRARVRSEDIVVVGAKN